MRAVATLPQGSQGPLLVRDKVGKTETKLERPPDELGVSNNKIIIIRQFVRRHNKTEQVLEMLYFPFSALTLLVGRQEWHLVGKNWVSVCWW